MQVDGAAESKQARVLLVGATNRPQELDEAARRRLVKRLYIPLPDDKGRMAMVKHLMEKEATSGTLSDFEMSRICELSSGFSGADIHTLCSDAAMGPVREHMMEGGDDIDNIEATNIRAISFAGAHLRFDLLIYTDSFMSIIMKIILILGSFTNSRVCMVQTLSHLLRELKLV